MPDITVNPDAIDIVVYGLGAVGALTVVNVLVHWLRKLLLVEGVWVRRLTAFVAIYVAATIYTTAVYPLAGAVLGFLVLSAFLATAADAFHEQSKTN